MKRLFRYLLGALLVLTFSNCNKVIKSPPQYHISRDSFEYEPYGSWINIEYKDSTNILQVFGGELISIQNDSLYLLDLSSNLYIIPTPSISNALLILHRSGVNNKQVAWSTAGLLFATTNGPFYILTGPAWMTLGAASLLLDSQHTESQKSLIYYNWEEIGKFGRFPRGIPPSVNPRKLKAKEFGRKSKLKK